MSAKYLLPCPCGRQVVVEPRQAGEMTVCSCGAALQIPTLLDMSGLESVPPEAAPPVPSTAWGFRQQLRFLGAVLVLIALGIGTWLYLKPPTSPFNLLDPENIQQTCQKMSPLDAWKTWEYFEQGLDPRIDEKYAEAMRTFRVWQIIDLAAGLLGVVLIAASSVRVKAIK